MFVALMAGIKAYNDPSIVFELTFAKGTLFFDVYSVVVSLLVVFGYLYIFFNLHGEKIRDIGLQKPEKFGSDLFLGSLIGIILAAIAVFWKVHLPGLEIETREIQLGGKLFSALASNFILAFLFGGLREELLFRGYLFRRLDQITNKKLRPAGVILTSGILFGILHLRRTPIDALWIITNALIYGILFQIRNRNLLAPIMAHGSYDFILFSFDEFFL